MTAAPKTQASTALAVLTLLNLFNYVDRYVVAAVVESLKRSELALSDAQAGMLMTAFVAVFTLVFPLFGYLGDRVSRPKLLAFGVFTWSLATIATGFAPSFASLLLCRALVGVGEAAYVTIAPALIADYVPEAKRGKAYAIFFSAIPVGAAIGFILGGLLDAQFGWRSAFWCCGGPGLLLAGLALRLDDPVRGRFDAAPAAAEASPRFAAAVGRMLRDPAYRFASLGYAAYAFGLGGLAFWLPAYMERVRGAAHADAATQTGVLVVATGLCGTVAGGWLADRLRRRRADADLLVCWASALLAVPLLAAAFAAPPTASAWFWACLIGAEVALFASSGPINGAVIASLPPALRALGLAFCNVITHVLGDVPSPATIGWLSDRSSLTAALYLVPAAMAACAALWWVAAAAFQRRGAPEPVPAAQEAA